MRRIALLPALSLSLVLGGCPAPPPAEPAAPAAIEAVAAEEKAPEEGATKAGATKEAAAKAPDASLAPKSALVDAPKPTAKPAPKLALRVATNAAPATRVVGQKDIYHGVEVADRYRWLEDWSQKEVKDWSGAQNAHTRKTLDALPGRDAIQARVAAALGGQTVSWWGLQHRGEMTFAETRQPPAQQPFIVVFPGTDITKARTLVDPNTIDTTGGTSIDWYDVSPDGKLIAVSLSKGGSESGDLHLFDVATGAPVHAVIKGVNGGTAGGNMAWQPDGKGFYYTRYPHSSEQPEAERAFWVQVYHHTLNSAADRDRYIIGKGLPKIAEYQLDMDNGTGRLMVTVQDGDGGKFAHFLIADGATTQLSKFGDGVLQFTFGPGATLYALSRKGAPRGQVVAGTVQNFVDGKTPVLIAEGEDTVVESFWGAPSIVPTESRIYIQYQQGGPSIIRAFNHDGTAATAPEQPSVAAVGGMMPLGGDDILFSARSFVSPTGYHHFDAAAGTTTKTTIAATSPVSFDDIEVVREFAISKDGTKVPVNILIPPGAKRDGTSPMIVTGYGGYGVNLTPRTRLSTRVGLDHGVIYAVANLRGGGEYGEAWHLGGNLTKKQNVFDDFAGVLKHVVQRGYTTTERLAITGGSNGGLLMGATLVQNPGIAHAVVSFVGIYDMLRVELSSNGAFNITEFGTVADKAQFEALHAYSPYHHVTAGTAYPPVLFLTGENDPRVDPMQSRKMTAALQAAVATSKAPGTTVLLRTSSNSGHGGGTPLNERVAQYTDYWAFMFHALGVTAKPLTDAQ